MQLPPNYWLAHPHWVREAEEEGRGTWVPARIDDLGPELAARVRAEIEYVRAHFGGEQAPKLWRRVD